MSRTMRYLLAVAAAPSLLAPTARATVDPGSPTTGWNAIAYPGLVPDWSDDQRTGIGEADIVGSDVDPAFYSRFDDAGTTDPADGTLAFRVRLGSDKNPPGFEHFLGVGLDADLDGALDLFLGVDNTGNADQVGIWDPGTDLNVSPSTTSIVDPPVFSYPETAANYDWSPVDGTIDPEASTFDVDGDGSNDQLLSFAVPFADVVAALVLGGIAGFDEDSTLRYVLGTSTQSNALNQDLGGPQGGTTSDLTWEELGATSSPTSASATSVPAPPAVLLVLSGLAALRGCRRT